MKVSESQGPEVAPKSCASSHLNHHHFLVLNLENMPLLCFIILEDGIFIEDMHTHFKAPSLPTHQRLP